MTQRNRTVKTLSVLLPAGAFGLSVALASAPADALGVPAQNVASEAGSGQGVSARLQAIRSGMSTVVAETAAKTDADPNIVKAWWGNGGFGRWGRWHGGWGNGGWGWHNGGWRNGGWGNGGWGNGWHNFWHNW
ncbi:MAG: GrrA/OscA1 family cyclophane-containing rSAM-modified RiPP [Acetobacteraceae bacterium]